jgi:hypothetical protein
VKAHRAGTLKRVSGKAGVTAEQMEIGRLRAELARVTMERDILHPTDEDLSMGTPAWEKRRHTLQRARSEVCLRGTSSAYLADLCAVSGAQGERVRLSSTSGAAPEDCSASPFEQRSAAGAYPGRVRGKSRSLRLAADLAGVVEARCSRGQAGVPSDRSSSLGWKQRVQRLMQQHGIQARGKRRFRVTTTDSRHDLPVASNLLSRNFTVAAPDRAWTGNITYIATEEGWLFLAVVIDLFSRKVVGWSMPPDMHRSLVIDALEMAWFQRRPDKTAGLIFHSDRGSQYASHEFRAVLSGHGITASMSRKGNCWDNACSETLFGSLKVDGCMANASRQSARPKMKPLPGCSGTTDNGCTQR